MLMSLEPFLYVAPFSSLYNLATFNPLTLEGYKCKGHVWGRMGRERKKK